MQVLHMWLKSNIPTITIKIALITTAIFSVCLSQSVPSTAITERDVYYAQPIYRVFTGGGLGGTLDLMFGNKITPMAGISLGLYRYYGLCGGGKECTSYNRLTIYRSGINFNILRPFTQGPKIGAFIDPPIARGANPNHTGEAASDLFTGKNVLYEPNTEIYAQLGYGLGGKRLFFGGGAGAIIRFMSPRNYQSVAVLNQSICALFGKSATSHLSPPVSKCNNAAANNATITIPGISAFVIGGATKNIGQSGYSISATLDISYTLFRVNELDFRRMKFNHVVAASIDNHTLGSTMIEWRNYHTAPALENISKSSVGFSFTLAMGMDVL